MYEFVKRADVEIRYVLHRKNVAKTYTNSFRQANSLVFYLNGGHRFFFGGKSVTAKAGNIAVLPYGAAYANEILTTDTEYYQIDFCIYEQSKPVAIVGEPEVIENLLTDNALLLFKSVFKNYCANKPCGMLMCIADTLRILAMIQNKPYEAGDGKFEEIIVYLKENCFCNQKIDEIAKHFNISVSQLEKKLRARFGMSPVEFKNYMRIEKAKQLLAEGRTIKEVAYITGFSDRYYFTKTFTRFTEQTPAQFVKSLAI